MKPYEEMDDAELLQRCNLAVMSLSHDLASTAAHLAFAPMDARAQLEFNFRGWVELLASCFKEADAWTEAQEQFHGPLLNELDRRFGCDEATLLKPAEEPPRAE